MFNPRLVRLFMSELVVHEIARGGADVVAEHVCFAEVLSRQKLSRARCSHGKRQGTRADHESADSPVLLLVR